MILSSLGLEGNSAQLSAEAQAALAAGDTDRAAALHKEAGELLESQIRNRRRQSDRQLLRFLAATQYYLGGLYARAAKLTRHIQAKFLPAEGRSGFEQFVRDVSDRSEQRYRARVKAALLRAWRAGDYRQVLTLFQEHPYVLPRGSLAFFRACCCEYLKDYRAAALFFEDTLRFEPSNLGMLFTSAGHPLTLIGEGKFAEAWAYVQRQLGAISHALPRISASLIQYHQASAARTSEERRQFSQDQIAYFREAWDLFLKMPPEHQQDKDMSDFMALCLEAAVFGMLRLEDQAGAAELANRAVTFSPASARARTVRGIVTYPSVSARQDFQDAAELGDPEYFPYYYLAHASFRQDDFDQAASWCEQALQHGPSTRVRAQLLEMLAISRSYQGENPEAIEALFTKAQELDPSNARLAHNWSVFKAAVATSSSAPKQQWLRGDVQNGSDYDIGLKNREQSILGKRSLPTLAQQELTGVA